VNDGEATQPTSSAATNTAAESRPDAEPPVEEMTVGELVFEVSDRASVLIREEIELAKTEVTEKLNSLLRGSVTALVAGIFVLLALLLAMHGFAWLLNDLVFDNFWAGFLVEAGLFLLIAAGAGLYAYRSLRRGAPPTPDMAIEEAKEIKQAFDGGEET
jgi:Putative Actinobacterial Holin-X, holin superfamily III